MCVLCLLPSDALSLVHILKTHMLQSLLFFFFPASLVPSPSVINDAVLADVLKSPDGFDYNFGWAVSVTSSYAIVGNPATEYYTGTAYVYQVQGECSTEGLSD
jgi:hypothetical protein